MDLHTLIVRSLLAVLFITIGLIFIVIVISLAVGTLDPQATLLVLGGIASGIIAYLAARAGAGAGGDT